MKGLRGDYRKEKKDFGKEKEKKFPVCCHILFWRYCMLLFQVKIGDKSQNRNNQKKKEGCIKFLINITVFLTFVQVQAGYFSTILLIILCAFK